MVGLLISSPQMRDPNFERTVVLLCQHDERGALGLVVNRETNLQLSEVVAEMGLPMSAPDRVVLWGGPVEPGTGFVVTRGIPAADDGWEVGHGVVVSPSRERLEAALQGQGPFLLCLGYAGWGPTQLDGEIELGAWLYTEVDVGLLFDLEVGERYDQALARLGLVAGQVWMHPVDE